MIRKYRYAKIYKGKTGAHSEKWFAFYYYLNPFNAKYTRFKVYEGINYCNTLEEKEEYAKELVGEINKALKAGYDPYKVENKTNEFILIKETEELIKQKNEDPDLLEAFKEFLNNKRKKNLSKQSLQAYEWYISGFENYLFETKKADIKLNIVDTKLIGNMLDWLKEENTWGETTYNTHLAFWGTLINWFAQHPRRWVKRDDFSIGRDGQLEPKIANVMKHQYFGETVMNKVKKLMEKLPVLNFYAMFIYYSCMRPDEIRKLKIENVDIEGRNIKIIGKTKSRAIPICDELAEMLISLNLDKYPLSYYVIGKEGEVAETTHSEGYYSRLFRIEIKEKLGLSKDFTLYGFKHTRCVHLLNAGYSDAEIMGLTGHRDTASYDKYKRDLAGNLVTRLRGKTTSF